MKDKIKALMLAPGEHPCITELSTADSALIRAVNKGIHRNYKYKFMDIDTYVSVMYNHQRSFAGLQPNRKINKDILCGTIYIVGNDTEDFLRSLDIDEFETYAKMFWDPEEYSMEEAQTANLTYTYTEQVLKRH